MHYSLKVERTTTSSNSGNGRNNDSSNSGGRNSNDDGKRMPPLPEQSPATRGKPKVQYHHHEEMSPTTPRTQKNFKIAQTKEPNRLMKLLSPGIPKQLEKRNETVPKPIRVNGKKVVQNSTAPTYNGGPAGSYSNVKAERRKSAKAGPGGGHGISPPNSMPVTSTTGRTPTSSRRKLKVKDLSSSQHNGTSNANGSKGMIAPPPLSGSSHHTKKGTNSSNFASHFISPRGQSKKKLDGGSRHGKKRASAHASTTARKYANDSSDDDVDGDEGELDEVMTMMPPPPLDSPVQQHHHTPKQQPKKKLSLNPSSPKSPKRRPSQAAAPKSPRAGRPRPKSKSMHGMSSSSEHTGVTAPTTNSSTAAAEQKFGEMNLNDTNHGTSTTSRRGRSKSATRSKTSSGRSRSKKRGTTMAEQYEQEQKQTRPKRSKSKPKQRATSLKNPISMEKTSKSDDIEAKVLLLKRRKELSNMGIPQEEIDLMLPLPK